MAGPVLNIGTDPTLLPWLSNVSKAAQEAQKQAKAAQAEIAKVTKSGGTVSSEMVANARRTQAMADKLKEQVEEAKHATHLAHDAHRGLRAATGLARNASKLMSGDLNAGDVAGVVMSAERQIARIAKAMGADAEIVKSISSALVALPIFIEAIQAVQGARDTIKDDSRISMKITEMWHKGHIGEEEQRFFKNASSNFNGRTNQDALNALEEGGKAAHAIREMSAKEAAKVLYENDTTLGSHYLTKDQAEVFTKNIQDKQKKYEQDSIRKYGKVDKDAIASAQKQAFFEVFNSKDGKALHLTDKSMAELFKKWVEAGEIDKLVDKHVHTAEQDENIEQQKRIGNFEAHMSGGTGEGRHLIWGKNAEAMAAARAKKDAPIDPRGDEGAAGNAGAAGPAGADKMTVRDFWKNKPEQRGGFDTPANRAYQDEINKKHAAWVARTHHDPAESVRYNAENKRKHDEFLSRTGNSNLAEFVLRQEKYAMRPAADKAHSAY